MSVDSVNYALTKVRLSILQHPDAYSPEGREKLLRFADMLRHYLMVEDVEDFNAYINDKLASDPDAMDFLLDALFEQLGFGDNGVREDLDAALAAA